MQMWFVLRALSALRRRLSSSSLSVGGQKETQHKPEMTNTQIRKTHHREWMHAQCTHIQLKQMGLMPWNGLMGKLEFTIEIINYLIFFLFKFSRTLFIRGRGNIEDFFNKIYVALQILVIFLSDNVLSLTVHIQVCCLPG